MAKKKRSKSRASGRTSGRSKQAETTPLNVEEKKGGCCGGSSSASNVAPSPERSAPDSWKAGSSSEEQLAPPAPAAPAQDEAIVGADKTHEVLEAVAMPAASPSADAAAAASGSSNPPAEPETKPTAKAPSKQETFGTFVGSFAPTQSMGVDGEDKSLERAPTHDELAALVESSMDRTEEQQQQRCRRSSAAKAPRRAMGDAEAALAAAEGDEKISRALEKVGIQPMGGRQRRDSATIASDSPMLANTPLGRRLQAQAEEQARRNSEAT